MLGEDEEDTIEEEYKEKQRGSSVPLFQAVVCILLLVALLLLKFSDQEKYQEIANWYNQEAAEEIQLPQWRAQSSPAPEEDASSSGRKGAAANVDDQHVQLI